MPKEIEESQQSSSFSITYSKSVLKYIKQNKNYKESNTKIVMKATTSKEKTYSEIETLILFIGST